MFTSFQALFLILMPSKIAVVHFSWFYITLPWHYPTRLHYSTMALLHCTWLYYTIRAILSPTSLYCLLYTMHGFYFTLLDFTLLYQGNGWSSLYLTLYITLYHGSSSPYITLLPSEVLPFLYLTLHYSTLDITSLYLTLLLSTTALLLPYFTMHGSTSLYFTLHYSDRALLDTTLL